MSHDTTKKWRASILSSKIYKTLLISLFFFFFFFNLTWNGKYLEVAKYVKIIEPKRERERKRINRLCVCRITLFTLFCTKTCTLNGFKTCFLFGNQKKLNFCRRFSKHTERKITSRETALERQYLISCDHKLLFALWSFEGSRAHASLSELALALNKIPLE